MEELVADSRHVPSGDPPYVYFGPFGDWCKNVADPSVVFVVPRPCLLQRPPLVLLPLLVALDEPLGKLRERGGRTGQYVEQS